MTTSLTTRITAGTGATVKNSPLTSAEVDNNFLSLNDNKLENTGGSINGNLTITGNLTVSGTTVTIDATNLAVADNMIYLNDGSTVSNPDLGFAGNYNDGTYAHTGVFRDADDGRWKFYEGYTPEPDASAFIDTGHASFTLAEVQASTFYGDLSGNATSATSAGKLSTARTIQLSGDVTGSASFDGSAAINITTTVADNSHSHSNYLPVAGGTLTGKLVAGSTDGDSLEIRNDTAAAASSSYITFTNKNETDTYRPASRISGVTVDNAFDGDFLVETYSGGVAYKGLRVDENSKVFFYDTSGNTKFEWDSVNTRALINNNVIWHAGNDGSGSGLDADLLDGNHASAFALSGHTHSYLPLSGGTLTGNLTMGTNAIYGSSTSYALDFNSTDITLTSVGDIWLYADSNDNETTRYINLAAGQNTLKIYGGAGSQTDSITYNGNKVWHAGNDGSGSGLDADLLDGQNGSYYATASSVAAINTTIGDIQAALIAING